MQDLRRESHKKKELRDLWSSVRPESKGIEAVSQPRRVKTPQFCVYFDFSLFCFILWATFMIIN
jgi:hypothetical protein